MCDMTHSHVWHDSFTCVTWPIYMCDMIHSHVWHDSFVCVKSLIYMCDMTHPYVWHDSFMCLTRTRQYVWYNSFTCVTWLIHTSTPCVTWLIHMCDMTNSYVWHHSFIRLTWLILTCDQKKFTNVQAAKRAGMICGIRVAVSCKGQVIFFPKKKSHPDTEMTIFSRLLSSLLNISWDSQSLRTVYFNTKYFFLGPLKKSHPDTEVTIFSRL